MRRIEIEFLGQIAIVRFLCGAADCVRQWDEIYPDQVWDQLGLSYSELCQLGAGFHDIQDLIRACPATIGS
jgi:hypothetical protein